MRSEAKTSELYTFYLAIFENDARGDYSEVSSSIEELEPLQGVGSNNKNELNECLKKDIDKLKALIKEAVESEGLDKDHLNYSLITKKIYEKNGDYDYFALIENLQDNYLTDGSEYSNIIFKLLRHTELALVQKSSLSDRIVTLEGELKDAIKKSSELNSKLEERNTYWNDQFEKLKKEFNGLMPEIIGIMGVFSTIIFAVFSDFNEITTLGQSLAKTPISKVLIYVGSTFIVLIGIVFISYFAIGKFFEKSLRSCGCDSNSSCEHDLIEKYPTVITFVWVGISFVSIGAIMRIFRDYLNLPNVMLLGYNVFVAILLLLLIIVPVGGFGWVFSKRVKTIFNHPKNKNSE